MTTPKSASKSKKSEQWNQCESCGTIITIRDSEKHQTDCPPNPKIFTHFYIRNSCLLGSLNLMNEESQDARDGLNKFVFLSQSCMQICDIAISNWTVLKINDLAPIVKRARPTTGKSLTSVHLTKEVLDLYFGDVKAYPTVSVTKLTQYTKDALVITLKSIGRLKTTEITPEIEKRLCYIFKRTILTNGNKISIFYFGRLLKFSIKEVKSENSDPVTNFDNLNLSDTFYEVTENTKWVLFKNHEETQNVNNQETVSKVGGLTEQLNKIKTWMDNALTVTEEAKRFTNVLLVGSSGTGKTTLVNYLVNESKVNVEFLNSTKFLAQSRESLKKMFEDALSNAPTVMVFDELDQICSECSKVEQKFLLEDLLTHLDKLNNNRGAKVFVIGITTDISNVAPKLTNPGTFDHEINIPMPKPAARKEILEIVLEIYKHNITEDQLLEISKDTRGYVGRDLVKLCSRAKFTMLNDSRSVMEISDLKFAMKHFVPSGSKDFHVEVPNVKWSDIGGQEELKNLLKHCIEDILHPERYERMGKLAPKGVLMYGPPGCSKTTIAKALATESGFNFFSIKAAELFNKYVGESQQAIIKLFKRAREVSPSVIFFDEVDAIACMRGSESGDANNVQANVLMQLLLEIDGVSPLEGLIVLAATNRLDRLDTALYRGGRLMKVLVPLPDYETRMKIFELKFRKIPVKDIDIRMLVDRTEKCCGAYIEELCHSAARIALDENPEPFVTMEHFKKALETMTNQNSGGVESMAPRNDNNAENACKKCSKEVKICVTCYSCESKYHPSCILKINGIYVDSGKVLCCDDITSKLIEYRKMEQELQKEKSRLVSLNQLCFEQSMSQTNMIEDGSIAIQEDCNEDMPKKIEIESTDTITTGENKEYEIMYLNRIIEEKADMNEELRDKIKVLNEYISLLKKVDKNETSLVPSPRETSNPTDNNNNVFIFIRNMFLRLFHVDIGNIF